MSISNFSHHRIYRDHARSSVRLLRTRNNNTFCPHNSISQQPLASPSSIFVILRHFTRLVRIAAMFSPLAVGFASRSRVIVTHVYNVYTRYRSFSPKSPTQRDGPARAGSGYHRCVSHSGGGVGGRRGEEEEEEDDGTEVEGENRPMSTRARERGDCPAKSRGAASAMPRHKLASTQERRGYVREYRELCLRGRPRSLC